MDSDKSPNVKVQSKYRKAWAPPLVDYPKPSDDPPSPSDPDFRPSQETQDHDSKSETSDQGLFHKYEQLHETLASPMDNETSVADLVRDSCELQEEIQSLATFCQRVSPKQSSKSGNRKEGDRDEAREERTKDTEKESEDLARIRNQLIEVGLPAFKDPPTISSLLSCLSTVLASYSQLQSSQSVLLTKFQSLADKHKALLSSAESLNKRVAKYKSKARDTTLATLKQYMEFEGEGKPMEVFKNFFRREFRPHSETDTKTMALIILYENRAKKEAVQGKNRKRSGSEDRQAGSQDLIARLIQEKCELQRLLSTSPSYEALHSVLGTKDPESALEVATKMQSVIKSLPRIESFVKQVCLAVFPELDRCDAEGRISCMDSIVPTLYEWREKLQRLTSMHRSLQKIYRLSPDCDSPDSIVPPTQLKSALDASESVTKFNQLFEVANRKETKDVIEQVFMFVHHTTTFLKVNSRQKAKYLLGMDEADASEVYERTLKELEGRLQEY